MIKFDILNRFTGSVQFTAEIEATEGTLPSIKLGLAVRAAVKARANLAGAYLAGANLADANLADAYLAGANLAGANLAGAYLADANLADANLAGANLADANLAGAKWSDGIPLTMQPLHVFGLRWPVTILDRHMQIGCQLHSLSEWASFDDRRITDMDGRNSLKFWREHKDTLLGMARATGRTFDALPASEAA